MPLTGNHPSCTLKRSTKMSPSQNDGVEMPTSTMTVKNISCQPNCFTAAMIPATIPMTAAKSSEEPARRSVGPSLSSTSSITGRFSE